MQTRDYIEHKLRQLKPTLSSKYGVDEIGYFGSYSSGTFNKKSDIDILVSFTKPPGWDFFDLKRLLEESLNLQVDLVSFDALRRELKNEIISQTKFIH